MNSKIFSINSLPNGLTPLNYNYLKYWFAHTNGGKEVFQEIFTWGFREPHSEIKNKLFQLDCYSNKRYRSDFDSSQRLKIENGNINKFDLSLFYLLIQRVCGLPEPSNKAWGKEGDPDSLPTILYQLKMKRNSLTHDPRTEITEQELHQEIEDLKLLFNKSLTAAGEKFNMLPSDVDLAKEKISSHLDSIRDASSGAIDIQIAAGDDDDDSSALDDIIRGLEKFGKNIVLAVDDAGRDLEKFGEKVGAELDVAGRDLQNLAEETGEKVSSELDVIGGDIKKEAEVTGEKISSELDVAGRDLQNVAEKTGEKVSSELDVVGSDVKKIADEVGNCFSNWSW